MILDEKFWLTICFVIFIIIAYRPAKRSILGIIDRKIDLIKEDLERAKLAKAEAEKAIDEAKAQLKKVIAERGNLISTAKAEVSKISQEKEKELNILLMRKQLDASSKLEQLKVAAIKDISDSFVQVAKKLSENYLKENPSKMPSDYQLAKRLVSPSTEK